MSFMIKAVHKKVYLPVIIFLIAVLFNYAAAEEKINVDDLSAKEKGPLVVYYSRSGNTRVVAETLSKTVAAKIIQIKSKKNREGVSGVFTCVLDQLMDRDDEQNPLSLDLSQYDPVFVVSPIWIHKLSSPARTFIKNAEFKGKEVYIVLTYNGKQSDEDEKELRDKVSSYGVIIKGLYKIITKKKDDKELKQETVNMASVFDKRFVKR